MVKTKRFVVKEKSSLGAYGEVRIIVDTITGVNYLLTLGQGYSGITPLLDSQGNIVIEGQKEEF